MGNCNLNRSAGDTIRSAGDWDPQDLDIDVQKSLASEWSIMPRVEGRLVKTAER